MVVKDKQLTDRAVYVYLPTVEMAKEWKSLAEKASISISKFVVEHVENSLKQEEDKENQGSSYQSRVQLLEQLKEKDEEISRLQQDNRLLKMLADNLDRELKHYRAKPFVIEDSDDESRGSGGSKRRFEGVRSYDKELIQLLRDNHGNSFDSDHILKKLGIKPTDIELVKAVSRQLHSLQAYGLVEPTARGWRWTG